IVVGGGPAGFMAAIEAARRAKEGGAKLDVTVLEATSKVLGKVKISGGGRCNVMHDYRKTTKLISEGYPRGQKPLLGPLSRFGPLDTLEWFKKEGVELKIEDDGRMFPITDNSQTIIDALCGAAERADVKVHTKTRVDDVKLVRDKEQEGISFEISCSVRSSRLAYAWATKLGHKLEDPVPSLFTFNIKQKVLDGLAGLAVQEVWMTVVYSQRGPVLITHTGLSGPAILRLSAFGLFQFLLLSLPLCLVVLHLLLLSCSSCSSRSSRSVGPAPPLLHFPTLNLPRRLWKRIARCELQVGWTSLAVPQTYQLGKVEGKGAFKEEFVTAGGVPLPEVDMTKMESKVVPGLFFAGELLDIDGITVGGYNLQSAWTTGHAAGRRRG
ncbi:hypothetical protein GUITHDRAFT_55772, partial [Guillardia theta CCMP2712]